MAASAPDGPSAAPRAAMLLPVAFLLHLAEEWFGGLPAWTLIAPGGEVSPERFLLINAIAFLLFGIGTLAAFHYPSMAWFGASFAALVGLNGALHTLATLGLGYYSPGTVTGLLLYIPLRVLSYCGRRRPDFQGLSSPVPSCLVSYFMALLISLLASERPAVVNTESAAPCDVVGQRRRRSHGFGSPWSL